MKKKKKRERQRLLISENQANQRQRSWYRWTISSFNTIYQSWREKKTLKTRQRKEFSRKKRRLRAWNQPKDTKKTTEKDYAHEKGPAENEKQGWHTPKIKKVAWKRARCKQKSRSMPGLWSENGRLFDASKTKRPPDGPAISKKDPPANKTTIYFSQDAEHILFVTKVATVNGLGFRGQYNGKHIEIAFVTKVCIDLSRAGRIYCCFQNGDKKWAKFVISKNMFVFISKEINLPLNVKCAKHHDKARLT